MASELRRIDWSSVPTVFIVVATCPRCGCCEYDRTKTADNGDGTRTRKVICRACSQPYKISVEMPEPGNEPSAIV
jgi:hypothetical protein